MFVFQSSPDCVDQVYGQTMCDDCLAIRRRYHCASVLPKCLDEDNDSIEICEGLCREVNTRCSSDISCDDLPDSDCSPAPSLSITLTPAIIALLVLVYI